VDDPQDFRIQPCLSPVWDTAINVIALVESGLEPAHPPLQRAVTWLRNKEVRVAGDWQHKNPHPEASGWAFEFNNVFYPDTDDTMMVLMALRLVPPSSEQSVSNGALEEQPAADHAAQFSRGLNWLLSFSMSKRRLGCIRQGCAAALAGRCSVRGP
jgi:squalene-hopene/tetraprenyl-beta-curcumene cyclase